MKYLLIILFLSGCAAGKETITSNPAPEYENVYHPAAQETTELSDILIKELSRFHRRGESEKSLREDLAECRKQVDECPASVAECNRLQRVKLANGTIVRGHGWHDGYCLSIEQSCDDTEEELNHFLGIRQASKAYLRQCEVSEHPIGCEGVYKALYK